MNNCHLFNFYTLYEFRFSDWLICTTWYWVVTKQPHWSHYCGFIAVVQIQHTTVITPWPRLTQSLTICQMQTLILLLIMQFVKTPRKQLLGEYLFWKVRRRILNFFIQGSWGVFAACCQQFYQLCAVHSISIIKMLTHSLLVNIGIYLYSFTNHEPEIFNTHSAKPRVVLKDLVHR